MIENARRYIQSIAFVNKLAEDLKRSAIQRLQDIDDVIDATVSQILAERDERCFKCINNEFCTKEIHPLVENPGELIANFDNLHLSGRYSCLARLSLFMMSIRKFLPECSS